MKKLYSLLFGLLLAISVNAQSLLLDVPIGPIDSLQDQSTFNNQVSWNVLPPIGFAQDEYNVNNSAILCGVREWLEVDYSNFINLQIDTLTFHVKLLMQASANPSFPFPLLDKALIFGQESNLGLRFNYADSTITDYDSLLQYKVAQPTVDWLKLRLSYFPDSTVQLWVNDSLIGTAQRNSNLLLNSTDRLGLGLFDGSEYLFGRVDSIKLERTAPQVIVGIEDSKLETAKEEISIFPNPANEFLQISVQEKFLGKRLLIYNSNGQLVQSSRINNRNTTLDISKINSGIYFISVPSMNINEKLLIY